MRKIMMYLKVVGYFLSIVYPLIDACKGVKEGVKKGKKDVEDEKQKKIDDEHRRKTEWIQKGIL